jgi:hypothetical protein
MDTNTRDAYYQKMKAQLEQLEAKLASGKAKIKEKVADAKIASQDSSDEMERHRNALRQKLDELKRTADDKWENVKNEVEQRWAALKDHLADKQQP